MKILKFLYRVFRAFALPILKGNFSPNIRNLKTDSETCYILGNGPSLIHQLTDSDFLYKQKNLFVVNNFVLTNHYKILKPRNYIFADPCYWDNKKHFDQYLKSQNILEKVSKDTNWKINIIAPKDAESCFRKHFDTNEFIDLYFINTNLVEPYHLNITYSLYSKYLAIPHCQNVLVLAIYLALNIGFKEINLLGAEHSWTENIRVNNDNQVCLMDKHFYELNAKLVPWINVEGRVYKMNEVLVDLSKMFSDYYVMSDYAIYKGANVYNCTPNSYVDAFNRKSI